MRTILITGLLAAASCAFGQTAAELMQKGIYTQDTVGNLDDAIVIYRQIVNSGSSPRDIAAQAQYRLAQSLLQKGDLGTAATEFDKLARSYADYSKLVSSLAAQAEHSLKPAAIPYGFAAGNPLAQMQARVATLIRAQQSLSNLNDPEMAAQRQKNLAKLEVNLEVLKQMQNAMAEGAPQRDLDAEKRALAKVQRQLEELHLEPMLQKTTATPDDRLIRPGDRINIEVVGQPKLSGPVDVDSTGAIRLPLAGSLRVDGFTTSQLSESIRSALSPYIDGVTVRVSVKPRP